MALVQVDHRRMERLLRIERTIEAQARLCAVLMRWAQERENRGVYVERARDLIHLQAQRAIYHYLIGREWQRITAPPVAEEGWHTST